MYKCCTRQYYNRLDQKTYNITQYCFRTTVSLSYRVIQNIVPTDYIMSTPLFILHDLLSNKKHWNSIGKIINNLTKRPVVTVDLRNHGKSPHTSSHGYEEMAEDVQKLLNKLHVDKAFFLGHGIGGKATMCTALMAPHKVAGMMIIDVSPSTSPKQFKNVYLNVFTLMKNVSFKSDTSVETAQANVKNRLKEAIHDDAILDIIISNIVIRSDLTIGWACNLDILIKYFNSMASFPKKLKGQKYYGPTLFIGGQLSEYLPADDLTSVRNFFPSAVITYVRNTGHNLHLDDTKSFLEIVISHLK